MFTELTNENYSQMIKDTQSGVILCKKDLCPHCKNMGVVVEKFSAMVGGDVKYYSINSQTQTDALAGVGAERVPTICIIKNGRIASVKSGLMNPRELEALFKSV